MDSEKQPLVTCVITTYKRTSKIFERALVSIVKQSYSNIEIIIVNDYPNDKKLVSELYDIIKKYQLERKIEYIVVEKNGGACKARNIALKKANGKYIAFLDDDDEWYAEKIEKQVKIANEKHAKLVYCNSLIKYENINKEELRFKVIQPSGYIYDKLLFGNIIGSCSFPLIETKLLIDSNGFNEEMPAMQDYELYLRIAKDNIVEYIHDPLVIYYSYAGERISRNFEARVKALEKIYNMLINEVNNNKKLKLKFDVSFFKAYLDNNQRKDAVERLISIIKYNPLNIFFNCKYILMFFLKPFKHSRKI